MRIKTLILFLALFSLSWQTVSAKKSHGLSTFGDLKYPADFKHFDYVNPKAPKGGRIVLAGQTGTFTSFNGYIIQGVPAQGLGYFAESQKVFDQLMVRAWDEPDAVYGLVAHSAEVADDKKSVTFYMRKEAKFADGTSLTADDVVFTFNTLKKEGYPAFSYPLQAVSKAEALDKYTVRYHFTGNNVRDLPIIVATLPIFSKAYYTKNKFNQVSLKPPLGSGPYKISAFQAGSLVVYERRKDYWGKDLPVNVGRFNFDEIRYRYYRERLISFEALKKGDVELREEFTSKRWATQYTFKTLKDGRVVRKVLPDKRPSGAQGFFINTRRPHLKDPRVREAIALAFDFEWTNRALFHNLYTRTHSYFENSDMKADGLPSKEELALLAPFKDKLLSSVLKSPPYTPPVSNGTGLDRKLLLKASKLLKQAGWVVKKGKRVNAKGERLKVEFLTRETGIDRIIIPYLKNFEVLGIDAKIRHVDVASYELRSKKFDFDIIVQRYVMSLTPGIELQNYFHSKTANINGSFNLAGIKNPVIDALLDKILQAKNRQELTVATRALDRVLRSEHYWVPHWYKASHHLAYWNRFSAPKVKPLYHRGILETWWFDANKIRKN